MKKNILLSIFSFVIFFATAQEKNVTNDPVDLQKTAILHLKYDTPIPVYTKPPGERAWALTAKTVKVSKVTINIRDGYVLEINIYTDQGQFINTTSQITLTTNRLNSGDYLKAIAKNEYLLLSDLLSIEPLFEYLSDDGRIELDKDHIQVTLTRNVGVNTVFDARLYTDVLGLLSKEENPVLQTDVRFRQVFNRRNLRNTGIILFNYVSINGNASKLDSKTAAVDSLTFNRTDLMQKSILGAEATVNLGTIWLEKHSLSTFYTDIGGGINLTNVSGFKDIKRINSHYVFGQSGFNIKSSDNVGFDMCARVLVQYSPQTGYDGNSNAVWYLKLSGEVFYNPSSDGTNRIFGRLGYILPMKHDEKKNLYFQLQFGYSVLLSKLLKGKAPGYM